MSLCSACSTDQVSFLKYWCCMILWITNRIAFLTKDEPIFWVIPDCKLFTIVLALISTAYLMLGTDQLVFCNHSAYNGKQFNVQKTFSIQPSLQSRCKSLGFLYYHLDQSEGSQLALFGTEVSLLFCDWYSAVTTSLHSLLNFILQLQTSER